jgi:hypothetical protein
MTMDIFIYNKMKTSLFHLRSVQDEVRIAYKHSIQECKCDLDKVRRKNLEKVREALYQVELQLTVILNNEIMRR